MRYSRAAGAKVYRAALGNVERTGDPPVDLPAGVSADAAGKRRGGRRGQRGSGFGSAGSRSKAQATAARESARELLESLPDDAAVCFTDGACKGNPGPAGAGCVVRMPDGTRHEDWRALGTGTNNIGELTAIAMALDILDREGFDGPVHVLTDSRYSKGVLVDGWKAKANQELVATVQDRLRRRDVTLHWIAGHVGIPDNERADALANMGVDESRRRR
ncbi:MAG: reverse transcriptase-like protein [Deltaproteobacteria bacterium]|nr:MAG: reverse transcriptase-like protein [Deltaproteobacteria bacterium]